MTAEFIVALHSIVYLSHTGKTLTSEQIAENVCTNPARVRKVMAKLKKAGLVGTKGGFDGGYEFIRDPEKTTLHDIFAATSRRFIKLTWRSGSSGNACPISRAMGPFTDELFRRLDTACNDILESVTVAEILRRIFNEKAGECAVIPLGGNSFVTSGSGGRVVQDGWDKWNGDAEFISFFRLRDDAEADLSLRIAPQKHEAAVKAEAAGKTVEAHVKPGADNIDFGSFAFKKGYNIVRFRGVSRSGTVFCRPDALLLRGAAAALAEGFVKEGDGGNYYWTRRGPSVHCGYDTSGCDDVEWFYNEVTVPVAPIGTYAMAIGFSGGYFGIQVNSPTERRILFSIWSPHVTDNPGEIPEDKRVVCLYRHPNMRVNDFGGEGSGGQSHMKYMWKTGETYRFLMRAKPDGEGKTAFTAYFFFPETGKWERLATLLRPYTDTYLTGIHSFLESFDDEGGYKYREARFGNQWAFGSDGKAHKITKVRFTADATARAENRLDYGGSTGPDDPRAQLFEDGAGTITPVPNGVFRLYNCGFFSEHGEIGSVMERTSDGEMPDIDFNTLM